MRAAQENKSLRLRPDLANAVQAMLRPYKGRVRDAAEEAVLRTLHSGLLGTYGALIQAYGSAIAKATGDGAEDVVARVSGRNT